MTQRPMFSQRERRAVMRAIRIVAGVAILIAAAALALALASAHPTDDGFYAVGFAETRNWMGDAGAMIADLLFMTIGAGAYAAVALAAAWGLKILANRAPTHPTRRLLIAPIALVALAGFASALWGETETQAGLGGVIGDFVAGVLRDSLPFADAGSRGLAAGALLGAACAAGLAYASGRGWDMWGRAARAMGRRVSQATDRVADRMDAGAAALRAREEAAYEARLAAEAAAPPRPGVAAMMGRYAARMAERAIARARAARLRRSRPAPALPALPKPPAAPRDDEEAATAAPRRALAPPRREPPRRAAAPIEPGFASTRLDGLAAAHAAAHPDDDADHAAPRDAEDWDDDRFDEAARMLDDPRAEAEDDAWDPGARGATRALETAWDDDADALRDSGTRPATEASRRAPSWDAAWDDDDAWDPAPAAEWDFDAPEAAEQRPAPAADTPLATIDLDMPMRRLDPTAPPPMRAAAPAEPAGYRAPALSLLARPPEAERQRMTERMLAEAADALQAVLTDFGVRGEIIDVNPGPVVSQFELEPAPGLKAARVIGLADDIARSMRAVSARISTIPGRNIIGIELPNARRETVYLRDLFESPRFGRDGGALPLALGADIVGEPVVEDLAQMPHLLIAGTTGSGKSVALNAMLLSLIRARSPEELRLILIDPKMLELSVYNGLPHLLAPVVTDPKAAVSSLKWLVTEMERRYRAMSMLNVRSLESYNRRVRDARETGEDLVRPVQTGFDDETGAPILETPGPAIEEMPMIVVVIDEMADLMMIAGKEIEHCVQRLAQMARASGIHLITATQRPSVDVVTGVIKANFPVRMSFKVTSKIDSRTILGEGGAEQLLGKGDMLYTAGGGRLRRVHAPFVSDEEVAATADDLRRRYKPDYRLDFSTAAGGEAEGEAAAGAGGGSDDADDALYAEARALVAREGKASTSLIQRRLQIGYPRAARIIELLEDRGVVSPANHVGKREVLIGADDARASA